MKIVFLRLGIVVMLLMAPVVISSLIAQVPDPDDGGNGPGPVGAPIDGGALVLLAAGAALAGKKIYTVRKNKSHKV